MPQELAVDPERQEGGGHCGEQPYYEVDLWAVVLHLSYPEGRRAAGALNCPIRRRVWSIVATKACTISSCRVQTKRGSREGKAS